MSCYRRGDRWWVDWRRQGWPRIQCSTGSTTKPYAKAMVRTLDSLREAGRRDILGLLAEGRLSLTEVHADYVRNPTALDRRTEAAKAPALGPLVDRWLAWLKSPAALSRRRQPFATNTVHRYWESWQRLLRALPNGREATLADLTQGFIAAYRAERRSDGKAGATINRDLMALRAFLRWCTEEEHLTVPTLKLVREREPSGRERWLSAGELAALLAALPPEWRPLVALLAHTGLRVGEALALRGQDVRLSERRLVVRGGKTAAAARMLPISSVLAPLLAEHSVRNPAGPTDLLFRGALGDYRRLRRAFGKAASLAGLHDLRIHDLRHTFAVTAVQNGVPLVRLQKLLGHATPAMVMRYAAHSPSAYMDEDAERIAASLSVAAVEREAVAQADLARQQVRLVESA